MDSIRDFFKRMKQRPSTYLVILLLSLILSAIEAYNPFIIQNGSFEYVLKHNYMETLSDWTSVAEKFIEEGGWSGSLGNFLLYALIFSILISFVLSGYINVLISSVDGKKKKRGEFGIGIKRNFLKVALYVFFASIMLIPFCILLLYAVIPALATIMMFFDGNTKIIFLMLILAILTIIVMLFAMLFYALYVTYVLPSIAGMRKKSVWTGIKMANTYCWYLLPKTGLFMFFDALIRIILLIIHYGHQSMALSIIVLLITAILRSILYYIYFYFAFNTFIAMRDDIYPDYREEERQREEAFEAAKRSNKQRNNQKKGMPVKQKSPKPEMIKKSSQQKPVSKIKDSDNTLEERTVRRHTVRAHIDDVNELYAKEEKSETECGKSEDEYDDSFEP